MVERCFKPGRGAFGHARSCEVHHFADASQFAYVAVSYIRFSNSLIIHEAKKKEITTVKEVWICDPNYHKIRRSFALIFSKNYQCFEKLYQTLERVFHQISKHFEAG